MAMARNRLGVGVSVLGLHPHLARVRALNAAGEAGVSDIPKAGSLAALLHRKQGVADYLPWESTFEFATMLVRILSLSSFIDSGIIISPPRGGTWP